MGPITLSFDVTDALPAEATEGAKISISAWAFFPDDMSKLGPRPVTMALLAGGSYDKRYHHVVIPGRPGYSAAEHLAGLGDIVILLDHLGVGESTRLPNQKKATPQVVALANHAALSQFYAQLRAGKVHPKIPAIADFVRIGGGHSMGAMQTVIQQAECRTYQAIMVMGYTAAGVHFVMNGKKVDANDFVPVDRDSGPDYGSVDRSSQRGNFHWRDVPEDVMRADDAIAVPTPSRIGLDSIKRGIIKNEAANIDVPVFFGHGEQDVSPDAHAELSLYPKCGDFTLFVLPTSAHCQTFASTRHLFWNRMHGWAHSIAA